MTPQRNGLQTFVEDETAATVVAVDRTDKADATVPTTAGIKETAVSRQAQRVQVSVRIDEGNPRDPVCDRAGQEAPPVLACTGSDEDRNSPEGLQPAPPPPPPRIVLRRQV